MAWKKAPDWLEQAFAELPLADPMIEKRKMFGYPCAFANDNMFIGLHEDRLVLRLPEDERERFLEDYETEIFSPFPGRKMREYVVVPADLLDRREEFDPWVEISMTYAASVEKKKKKSKKPSKRSSTRSAKKETKEAPS